MTLLQGCGGGGSERYAGGGGSTAALGFNGGPLQSGCGGARGRGSHSSTLQLNLSAFCVTGGAFRGCFGVV